MKQLGHLKPLSSVARLVLSEVGTKPVTLVVLICGMLVTFFQYQAFLENSRVEKSFQLVEEWEVRGYKDAFDIYAAEVLKLEAEAVALNGPPLPYIQRKLSTPSEDIGSNLATLYYFFDKMALCVEQTLCERQLLNKYFGSSVKSFWEHTIGYLESRRKRAGDFGQFTEAFANSVIGP